MAQQVFDDLKKEWAAVCKELGCVAKPGVALTFVKALRKEARRQYAQNVEIMRSWDAASPTELQELDRLRRGWGPSTPTERQARHADLLACVQAFSIALTDLALPEEIEVTEEAQKAFDAAYDRVYAGYITVLELTQKMHEPIAKPDIDWESHATAAEAATTALVARAEHERDYLLSMFDDDNIMRGDIEGAFHRVINGESDGSPAPKEA